MTFDESKKSMGCDVVYGLPNANTNIINLGDDVSRDCVHLMLLQMARTSRDI